MIKEKAEEIITFFTSTSQIILLPPPHTLSFTGEDISLLKKKKKPTDVNCMTSSWLQSTHQ